MQDGKPGLEQGQNFWEKEVRMGRFPTRAEVGNEEIVKSRRATQQGFRNPKITKKKKRT